jgi:hypothetical protein
MPCRRQFLWFQSWVNTMAIKTVTNANLAEYVADRTAAGSKIATGEEQVAMADASPPSTDGSPTPGNPVIKPGVAETNSTAPDPGNAKPSGKQPDKTPVQTRIDELTRQRKEAEEFAEEEYTARLRAEAALAEELKKRPQVETPKPEELKRPSPKDFETQEAYDAAMEAYDQRRDARVRQDAIEQGKREAAIAAQNAAMFAKIQNAQKDFPDYQEVINAADLRKPNVPGHIQAAIIDSDFGAHIGYQLAKDPALESRIFKLSPAKALLELGKLEEKLEAKFAKSSVTTTTTTQPTLETSRAPAPLTTLKNGDGDIRPDLTKPMAFSEYKAQRLAAKRARR